MRRVSAGHSPTGSRPPLGGDLRRPAPNFCSQPKLASSAPKIEHRPGHVRVSTLINADGIAHAEAEDVGDAVSVDQII
jgi:hypothetical protein